MGAASCSRERRVFEGGMFDGIAAGGAQKTGQNFLQSRLYGEKNSLPLREMDADPVQGVEWEGGMDAHDLHDQALKESYEQVDGAVPSLAAYMSATARRM